MTLIDVLKVRLPNTRHVCRHGMPRGPKEMPCPNPRCGCAKRPGNQNHEFHKADPAGTALACEHCRVIAVRRK